MVFMNHVKLQEKKKKNYISYQKLFFFGGVGEDADAVNLTLHKV